MQIFFKGTFLRSLREASTCSSSGIIWGKHVYICPSTNMWSTFIAINLRASPVQGCFVVMTVDNITKWYYILSRCISQHWHTISISSWLRYRRARAFESLQSLIGEETEQCTLSILVSYPFVLSFAWYLNN